jgi:hypothetical protein
MPRDQGDRVLPELRDVDRWNVDNYLADVIANALREFKAVEAGYPGDSTEDEWNSELDAMIAGFSAYAAADSRPVQVGNAHVKVETALDLFRQRFYDLWT